MTPPARRGRMPAVSDADIRRVAAELLVSHGAEALSLRAIARELGITAPALYRYYPSRDELLAALRRDICRRLADDLAAQVAELPDDGVVRLFAICRAFRHWALAHRNEFTLVFASPSGGNPGTVRRFDESFGLVFLEAAGKVLAAYDLAPPPVESIPGALRTDLIAFQTELLALLAGSEQKFPAEKFDLGVAYLMMTVWVRLYGHVTLEVFGNYPMPVSDPDVLFDAVLTDLAAGIGLVAGDGG
ncbi:TetR/AcrR family transcriptional regulator [Nocardia speluncae]|uniref:TetR/AcrR family transcriptional regulator n=1 Tax=Nocardia speluncae TaxID=419477 RepID=A0A846XHB3_9NOCA|nr:TetR/AcrR family transcriptional regulator [Nocardia speluncae]NKY35538.1 TetR/AcrR family transcriptional regulator [Nocardia speluncae]